MKRLVLGLMFFLIPLVGWSQESVQLKVVAHPRYFLESEKQGVFLAGWSITNTMSGIKDNTNIFLGIGYAGKNWAIENMVWKQWNPTGNQFHLDFRFTARPTSKINLYLEGAPRLDKKGFYDFVIVEARVIKSLSLGVETENIHRPGQDVIGFGPRVAIPLPLNILGAKPSIAVSRQFRNVGPNITRIYTTFHWNF